ESINVQVATEINSKRYKKINFFLLNKVFYQYVTFGLFDRSLQVKKQCEKILLHLIQCELLVPDNFRLKLTQLIVIYMPFIQCLASQVETLGQFILKMSDDLLTPTINSAQSKQTEESLKLFLSPAIERLRSSMRYLYSKDKNLRKKGFLQTIGFLTKYHRMNQNDLNDDTFQDSCHQTFNLSEFYQRFLPDKYSDIAVRLKRTNRTFVMANQESNGSIFHTDNLLKIFNIFTSDSVDLEIKQNAGEQLAIMISTGDQRLHKAFINLDGINYCIRLLKKSLIDQTKQNLFLNNIHIETLNKIQASCISCLCNLFYWNKEIRQLYLFDIELYRLIIKCLIISLKIDLKLNQDRDITLSSTLDPNIDLSIYSNIKEDLSIILFLFLYNQVACLDYYNNNNNDFKNKFDLSQNLKDYLIVPFSLKTEQFELKQLEKEMFKTYELNYKLEYLIKKKVELYNQEISLSVNSNENSRLDLVRVLNRKFRLYWNFEWHGGSLLKLYNDLINNENLVNDSTNLNQIFNENLLLDKVDKFMVKYASPFCIFQQFCQSIKNCSTHTDALNLFDLIDVLVCLISECEIELEKESNDDFYVKNNLKYFFDRLNCDWHLSLNRFASILPSAKSKMDQALFSCSFRSIGKMLHLQAKFYDSISIKNFDPNFLSIDKWLFNMVYTNSSTLLIMIKQFLVNYESDETRINSNLVPLCELVRIYYDRLATSTSLLKDQIKMPSYELLKICIDQMQACEIEKFRNLNKLAILINLISSLLRVTISPLENDIIQENNVQIYIQLIKSLVQIINIFNIGRGGLSLSFMGNFITKTAHVSLLQLVKNCLIMGDNQFRIEIVRAVLCLKDEKNNLNGSSWLIPLLLHREPQIRSISFSLISLLILVPYARKKLLTNKSSIWSIGFNVLLNQYESSSVRTQACAFLINLTQCISLNIETDSHDLFVLRAQELQNLLEEVNFYKKIAYILSTFYPYDTYVFNDLVEQNKSSDISICSPLLVSSICQLLYNLSIILNKDALMMVNKNSIVKLLVSYVKPLHLLTSCRNAKDFKLSDDLIYMLQMICKYLNLCCQLDQNCVLMFLNESDNNNRFDLIFDLIECLTINTKDKIKLRPFFSVLFELLSTFLNLNEDKSTIEMCLIVISKCWQILTNYLLNDLLADEDSNDQINLNLIENGLKFYSIYLAKLTQLVNSNSSNNLKILFDNILYLFDLNESNLEDKSIGSQLTLKLIKLFDKYFMVDYSLSNMKIIIANVLKGLFVLSNTAKKTAFESGLIETIIEHLKHTHSKLNLKSLGSSKIALKENVLIIDLQQCLLILKYLMCNNLEIKESLCKIGIHSLIHSFWCWSIQDVNLLKSSLSTLCTFTANNKLGVNAMSQASITASTSNASNSFTGSTSSLTSNQSNYSNLSLLATIIKSLQKSLVNQQLKSSFIIQKYSFSLLANCAQSNECKNLIWKSNLIQDFTQLDFQLIKLNSVKFNFKLEKLWLYFLVSLSFSQDGQQFFIKVDNNLLQVIIKFLDPMLFTQQNDFQQQQIDLIQYLSLLILRNLSFNSSNKSKLLSNADYINTIIQYLAKNKSEKFHLLSLSALDSLLYDYQKSKVLLKNCLKYLVELNEFYYTKKKTHHHPHQDQESQQQKILNLTNNLIKILNEQ
ncbi:unnamed protein product, partial [Brachionus calyciflorus]